MRTFHTGGVAGKYLTGVAEVKKKKQESLRDLHEDIRRGLVSIEDGVEGMERERARAVQAVLKVLEDQVRGLLRVVELFEARKPKGQAIITEVAGKVVDIETTRSQAGGYPHRNAHVRYVGCCRRDPGRSTLSIRRPAM